MCKTEPCGLAGRVSSAFFDVSRHSCVTVKVVRPKSDEEEGQDVHLWVLSLFRTFVFFTFISIVLLMRTCFAKCLSCLLAYVLQGTHCSVKFATVNSLTLVITCPFFHDALMKPVTPPRWRNLTTRSTWFIRRAFTLFQQWDITLYLVFWRFLDQILYFMPNKVIEYLASLYSVCICRL